MGKKSGLVIWRNGLLQRLDKTLIVSGFVLSVIFFLAGHLMGSEYYRGIGVGLAISWVSALGYLYRMKKAKP